MVLNTSQSVPKYLIFSSLKYNFRRNIEELHTLSLLKSTKNQKKLPYISQEQSIQITT